MAIAILAGMIGFLLIMQTPVLRGFKSRVWEGWTIVVGSWFKIGDLSIDNSVDKQLNQLTAENIRLKAELRDLEEVRRQVGSVAYEEFEEIPVRLAALPIDLFKVNYLANKGSADGVQLYAPVVIEGPILIGIVAELEEYSSVVRMLFHPETNLPGEVMTGEKVAKGLINGDSFTGVKITRIPRDIEIEAGQAVVSSEVTDLIPGGIYIGKIDRVANDKHDPYQYGVLIPPYRASDIRAGVILTSP